VARFPDPDNSMCRRRGRQEQDSRWSVDRAESAVNANVPQLARSAYLRLSSAIQREDFAGWDPYDALSAAWLHSITPTPLLRRIAIQSVKRAPVNPRRLIGVEPLRHTKGLALCVSAYSRMVRQEEPDARNLAIGLAQELVNRGVRSEDGLGWGYDFDVQTRWGYYRRGMPNAVVTAFVAHALLDATELDDGDRFLQAARGAAAYACSRLAIKHGEEAYFAYFAGSRVPIHNASLLIASMIARCIDPDSEPRQLAERAMAYSLQHQQSDGSWRYGEAPSLEWVDGFHTAYVLQDLDRWHEHAKEPEVEDVLRRGLDLYLSRLIDADGAPRASLAARYPVDIHACATAISALSRLARWDSRARPTAIRVLEWTAANLSRADGQFAFQRHRWWRNSTPYFRWGNAHMLLALADLMSSPSTA
jgi:hypothetical protein